MEIKDDLVDAAGAVAEEGDRWFVSIARELGRTSGWIVRESTEIGDAAKAAAASTRNITEQLATRVRRTVMGPREDERTAHLAQQLGELMLAQSNAEFSAACQKRRFWKLVEDLHEAKGAPLETGDEEPQADEPPSE